MLLCEFCCNYKGEEKCELDLKIPKSMSCREFEPASEVLFDPTDLLTPTKSSRWQATWAEGKEPKR